MEYRFPSSPIRGGTNKFVSPFFLFYGLRMDFLRKTACRIDLLPVAEEVKRELRQAELLMGNGDGAFDFSEWSDVEFSDTFDLDTVQDYFFKKFHATSVEFERRGVRFTRQNGESESFRFDRFGRLSELTWKKPRLQKTFHYDYTDEGEQAAITVRKEIFSPEQSLPIRPEQFNLTEQGWLEKLGSEQHGGLLSRPEEWERLEWAFYNSHPRLQGRALYWLLLKSHGEGVEEGEAAQKLALRLWRQVDPQQLGVIFEEVPNVPFQSFLLAEVMLQRLSYFDAMIRRLPWEQQKKILHLFSTLDVENESDLRRLPRLSVPSGMKKLLQWMMPRAGEEGYDRENRALKKAVDRDWKNFDNECKLDMEKLKLKLGEEVAQDYDFGCWGEGSYLMLDKVEEATEERDKPMTYDAELVYHEALFQLGQRSREKIWSGEEILEENAAGLAAIRSDLNETRRDLTGEWSVWVKNGGAEEKTTVREIDLQRTRIRENMIRKGLAVYHEKEEDSAVLIGFGAGSHFAYSPFSMTPLDGTETYHFDFKTDRVVRELNSSSAFEYFLEDGGRTTTATVPFDPPMIFQGHAMGAKKDTGKEAEITFPDGSVSWIPYKGGHFVDDFQKAYEAYLEDSDKTP